MSFEHQLFQMVHGRPRPEDVADLVLRALGSTLRGEARQKLLRAARSSLAQTAWGYSSMATEFFRARVQVETQVRLAASFFGAAPLSWQAPSLSANDCRDPDKVEAFVREAGGLIHKEWGDRQKLDKRARRALGLFKGHRWYSKRFRLLLRLEQKLERMIRGERRYALLRASKSSLATRLPFDVFAADLGSACLVAYLSSRMSLRSTFTAGPQERAYDEIAEALLDHCEASGTASWLSIAHVMQDRRVVRHLTEEERGLLLAASFEVLRDAGSMLREVWDNSRFDRRTMIVSRGADSSTWNEAAGAWNKARDGWLSLLHALGMEGLLDRMLPGKVMRLMAADVARWHRATGGGIHPDTLVWAELPLPWEVLDGEAVCSRATVEAACTRHRAQLGGWSTPRAARAAVAFRPTPELVHGVTVGSPALARTLRKLGAFSGKPTRAGLGEVDFHVERDEHGFALLADEVEHH